MSLLEFVHSFHLTDILHRLRLLYRRILVRLVDDPTTELYDTWQTPLRSLDVWGIVANYIV